MLAAVPKLERRIAELQSFDPLTVQERGDPRVAALEKKLETMIDEVLVMTRSKRTISDHSTSMTTAFISQATSPRSTTDRPDQVGSGARSLESSDHHRPFPGEGG
jgi:hypothetical protein